MEQQSSLKSISYFESDFYRKSQYYPPPFLTDPSLILTNFKIHNPNYQFYNPNLNPPQPLYMVSAHPQDQNTIFNYNPHHLQQQGGNSSTPSSPRKSTYSQSPTLPPYPFEGSVKNISRPSSISPSHFNGPSSIQEPIPSPPNSSYSTNSSSPTSPISSPLLSNINSATPQECKLGSKCVLCERGQPPILLKTPTWASIMKVVFYTLSIANPEKEYFSLKTDVYEFMISHWDRLYMNKKKSDNWRKQVQDMLSHSKNVFESGMDKIKQNGFWKLKNCIDPWQVRQLVQSPSPSLSSSSSSIQTHDSPNINKKRSVDEYSSEDDLLSFDDTRPSTPTKKRSTNVDIVYNNYGGVEEPLVEEIKVMREEVAKLSKNIQVIRQKLIESPTSEVNSPNHNGNEVLDLESINETVQIQFKLIQEKLSEIDKKEKVINELVTKQQHLRLASSASSSPIISTSSLSSSSSSSLLPSPKQLSKSGSNGSLLNLLNNDDDEPTQYSTTFDSFNWSASPNKQK